MYSKENTDCGMLSLLNKLLIDNGISFIVSYNIHTLLMHAFYLIIVLIFLVMPKIIDSAVHYVIWRDFFVQIELGVEIANLGGE